MISAYSAPIVEALEQVGITHPFPIQSMAIPIALTGTDMIGQARTGTGKTLAFGITMLQRIVVPGERDYAQLAKPGAPQGLVVTPTRELASQVSADLTTAATRRRARVLTVYGGVGYDTQLTSLARGTEVVVGTPGRLLDLANRGSLDLSHIKVLVLDEADEMLDLGFLPDVERILALTPELRQTMLFSATMPAAIVSLARRHLRHPVNIRAESPGDDDDRAGHRAVRVPGARPGQAGGRGPDPAGREPQPGDDLLPDQALGPAGGRRHDRPWLRGGARSTATSTRSPGRRR